MATVSLGSNVGSKLRTIDLPKPADHRAHRRLSKREVRTPLTIVHTPDCTCLACGGAMRKVGEDISEVLDYIPGRFEVIRHIRPALSCRRCESMVQMPMPSLPVIGGDAAVTLESAVRWLDLAVVWMVVLTE